MPVLEALDQRGLLTRLLPEWEPVRSRPQRNAYHRFTVDRHLWEAAANASELVDRVARPDLLVLGALFHDIGKGYPGDHTEAGMELVRELGTARHRARRRRRVDRDGRAPPAAARRRRATRSRRPGDDLARRRQRRHGRGARSAPRPHRRRLEGDRPVGVGVVEGGARRRSRDACPSRARRWRRGGGDLAAVPRRRDVGADGRIGDHVRRRRRSRHGRDADVPGAFSRIAGVLSLHGLDVLSARAHSDEPQLGRSGWPRRSSASTCPRRASTGGRSRADLRRALAASWRSRPASPSGRAPIAAGGRCRRSSPDRRAWCSTTRRRATRPCSRCGPHQDRHPAPHHQGARRARPRHPPRDRADDRAWRSSTRSTCARGRASW